MVKGQIVPDDERSSESCPHSEIHDLVQEHVEGQEKFGRLRKSGAAPHRRLDCPRGS
jgi:hypothetical protein